MNDRNFLKSVIEDNAAMNKSIAYWLKDSRYLTHESEFLSHWLCNDVEAERNGRTDTQMALELMGELLKARNRNREESRKARRLLKTGKNLGGSNFERTVNFYLR